MLRAMPAVLAIAPSEVECKAVRAQGPGGQNVNKLSSAVQLRFDVAASSLPQGVKDRLLALRDHRITADGVVIIKAQSHRSQELNREDAMRRLEELVNSVAHAPRTRRPTRPTLASRRRRLRAKAERSEVKAGRGRVDRSGG
jgi:ribosome-associated protein